MNSIIMFNNKSGKYSLQQSVNELALDFQLNLQLQVCWLKINFENSNSKTHLVWFGILVTRRS